MSLAHVSSTNASSCAHAGSGTAIGELRWPQSGTASMRVGCRSACRGVRREWRNEHDREKRPAEHGGDPRIDPLVIC